MKKHSWLALVGESCRQGGTNVTRQLHFLNNDVFQIRLCYISPRSKAFSYLFIKRLSDILFETTLVIATKNINLLFGTFMNIKFWCSLWKKTFCYVLLQMGASLIKTNLIKRPCQPGLKRNAIKLSISIIAEGGEIFNHLILGLAARC